MTPASGMFLFVLAEGEEAAGYHPIVPDLKALIWAWVIFGILFLILRKFAWGPLLAMVEAREKRISESLAKADEVQRAAGEIAARQEAALAEAHAKAKGVLDEARVSAEEYRKREMEKSRGEADAFLDRAKKEIALEESRARESLRREVVDLTLEAASRVLERSVTGEDEKRLAGQMVDEIRRRGVGAVRN